MNAQDSAAEQTERKTYTALVYFHGIGEQKRYEEASRLVDELVRHDHGKDNSIQETGFDFEQPRSGLTRDVGFYRMTCKEQNGSCPEYRFYDAYYAHLLAGGVHPLRVFVWLFWLGYNPIKILLWRKQWWEVSRLRRAILLGGWDRHSKGRSDPTEDCRQILSAYDQFVSSDPLNGRPWKDFLDYLQKSELITNNSRDRIRTDADWWRTRFVSVQVFIFLFVLTLLVSLVAVPIYVATLIVHIPESILYPFLALGLLVGLVFIADGLRRFLRHFLGDLYLWTTYQETAEKNQKRRLILEYCLDFMTHILDDEYCERVVVIGHSMGTTVAHDTILELARRYRALDRDGNLRKKPDLDKIQHFITLGSVIDKVHYLFETESSPSYHYNSVIEEIRGDLGTYPFSKRQMREGSTRPKQVPQIHWINFWDQADLASSPLYTPTNRVFHPQHNNMVDNYEVAGDCSALPNSAHSNYVRNPEVIETIYQLFFKNQYNFKSFWEIKEAGENLPLIGSPRRGIWSTAVLQIVVALLPWLVLLRLIFERFNPPSAGSPLDLAILVHLILIVLLGAVDRLLRYLKNDALTKKETREEGLTASA